MLFYFFHSDKLDTEINADERFKRRFPQIADADRILKEDVNGGYAAEQAMLEQKFLKS